MVLPAGDEVPVLAGAVEAAAGGDGEVSDPAAEAQRCRQAAADARELAARALAEAEAEIRRITETVTSEIRRLEDQAADADSDAAYWEGQAALDARIDGLRGELAELSGKAAALTAEAVDLEQQAGETRDRLQRLAGRVTEVEARRVAAQHGDDPDEAVAVIKDVIAEMTAITEVAVVQQERLGSVLARLGEINGEAGELAKARAEFGAKAVELDAAVRERAGLPERTETYSMALGVLGLVVAHMLAADPVRLAGLMLGSVPEDQRGLMAEAIRLAPHGRPEQFMNLAVVSAAPSLLPGITSQLERLAAADPGAYDAVRRLAFPAPAEVTAPHDQRLEVLEDGSLVLGDSGQVLTPEGRLLFVPAGAVTGGR